MRTMKHFALATTAAAALALAGCGGGGSGASGGGANGPGMTDPMPVAAMGSVMLDERAQAAFQAAFMEMLPASGDSNMVEIAAGMSVMRQGVTFTCDSAYPCTVTVTNNLGTITASWSSQTLGDGMADVMASLPPPPHVPVSTFAQMNDGSTEAIRDLVTAQDGTTTLPTLQQTELIGMEIGEHGALDTSDAALRSIFDPNGPGFGPAPGNTAQIPGSAPRLTNGTTIVGAMRPDGDGIPASDDMAPAPTGFEMMTLHRDWGDTAGDTGDGGYETGAILVTNLGEGTAHPFDRDLSGRFAPLVPQFVFDMSIRADGTTDRDTGTSVSINHAGTTASTDMWNSMVFDSDSLVPAQSQDLLIDIGESFRGSYFGAPGQFQCINGAAAGESCALVRKDDGTVGVHDINAAPDVVDSTGRWSFTPDPGAMITVPDQDWIAYGAWLTTPNDPAGTHRMGVFFNGLDRWAPAANSLDATNAAGLHGSATYNGGATGIYVDGEESGLFTATATLMANFDVDGDGTADAGDYTISGRIDDFRGTDGVALGADTGDMPNPQGRGENDWVVNLGSLAIPASGAIAATATTGSADGVLWTGGWDGRFFGPTTDGDGDALAPSGVAGRFWAETADAATPANGDGLPATAVVGSFGAAR